MADDDPLPQILRLLDVLSVQVGRVEAKVDAGFERVEGRLDRVERRLGNLETRVEEVETRVEGLQTEVRGFGQNLEKRVSSLEAQQ